MKGSLIIVSFFIVGTLCGLLQLIPYDFSQSKLSFYALCGLMFCVGISIGNDPQTLKSFRSLNPRLLFLPVMTILGTLAGCAVVSLFLSHRSPSDCMAVGSGFGYLKYIHHRVQRSRIGYHRIAFKHHARNHRFALCPPIGKVLRKTSTHFSRRSHHHGHDSSHYHPLFRTGICHRLHFPWIHCRL